MANEHLIFTVYAPDKPGIVKTLSDIVLAHGGNWLESSLTRLCGQFCGIVHVTVPAARRDELAKALANTKQQGIEIALRNDANAAAGGSGATGSDGTIVRLSIEANDREGIVDEIASALAEHQINVEKLTSSCSSASMAGYDIFTANIKVALPAHLHSSDLETILENVSDDVMVNIKSD
ncbi:MAG: glycine cleavage system protein R [Pseudomonadales bacterium]|nr:glycine cleavage system protein R [Pseudomonadales bacterium]